MSSFPGVFISGKEGLYTLHKDVTGRISCVNTVMLKKFWLVQQFWPKKKSSWDNIVAKPLLSFEELWLRKRSHFCMCGCLLILLGSLKYPWGISTQPSEYDATWLQCSLNNLGSSWCRVMWPYGDKFWVSSSSIWIVYVFKVALLHVESMLYIFKSVTYHIL